MTCSIGKACVFCEIIAGRSPKSLVYEDDNLLVIMDIHPLSEGHCLVIPRQHSERVHELAPRLRAHLFEVGVQVRCAITASALVCDDANFIVNDGCHANQEVPHVHLHVIPRRKRDHLRILKRMLRKAFASRAHQAGYDQLDRQASLIRRALPEIIQAPN